MAKQTYADINTNNTGNSEGYKVSFFGLSDGEEAIVRFFINSVDDFEIYTVHPITIGQSSYPNRRVSCLRESVNAPLNHCPLCAKGEKVQQRIYIKMIQYVSENGQVVPKAVIWDRPAYSYAPQLKAYIDNYGPLTNIICKIARHGSGLDTKYDIIPNLNPQMYTEQMYPKNFSDFDNFNVLGGMIMDKTFEEINQFILTGSFPQRQQNNTATSTEPIQPQYNTPSVQNNNNTQTSSSVPSGNAQMARPTRYY